jgi:uncharacterized protein (TIGR03435 family)
LQELSGIAALCVSGVTGADLKKRVQLILNGRVPGSLTLPRKAILAAAGVMALAAPVIVGMMDAPAVRAQSADAPKFAAVFIGSCGAGTTAPGGRGGGPFVSTSIPVDSQGNFVIPEISPWTQLDVSCETVANLIHIAYGTFANGRFNRALFRPGTIPIEGGPVWVSSDRYRIDATAASPASGEILQGPMMQRLLEEKFKLKIHRETRDVPGYALVVANGGMKLPPFRGTCIPVHFEQFFAAAASVRFSGRVFEPAFTDFSKYCPSHGGGVSSVTIDAQGSTIDEFMGTFLLLKEPIVNKTGLTGLFNFHVEFGPDAVGWAGPGVSRSLEEQLGLKLEPARVRQDVLVIDQVARPAAN